MWRQVRWLAQKELITEWRNRYALVGIVLYLAATVFILYLGVQHLEPKYWVALYWMVVFFTAVTAVARSFLQESRWRMLYYHTLASPLALLLAKMLFHAVQLTGLSLAAWMLFCLMFSSPVVQPALFALIVVSGSLTFVLSFTMMSAIAAKANQAMLMAILCMPVVLPAIMVVLRLSQAALSPASGTFPWEDLLLLWTLDVILLLLALILFPYLWRD